MDLFTKTSKMSLVAVVYADGGSRGNPGKAACGGILYNKKGKTIATFSEYLGDNMTNNQAEYLGVIHALQLCNEKNITDVVAYLDSKLVVEQLNERWKIKNEGLRKLAIKAFELMDGFASVKLKHVKREKNKKADALVNQALDNR